MPNYPSIQNTDDNLYLAVNNLATVLTDNPLTSGATTVNVASTTGFPTVGIITIDLEAIHYTGVTATSFTGCTRGFDGTTAASHALNATVFHDIPAAHHNVVKDELKAVTDDLRDTFTADLDDSATVTATAADLKERLDQIVTKLKEIISGGDWKDTPSDTINGISAELVAVQSDLNDAVTPAASAADLVTRLNHIATALVAITGESDWKTAPSNTISALETQQNTNETNISDLQKLFGYRRPVLEFASVSTITIENNTSVASQTEIVYPDGESRASTALRTVDITATAEYTSGTEVSGLHTSLSEANNTWYAIYAVKSLINSANNVYVMDTTFPFQANFATLNSRYGTNSWVYLGAVRNGQNDGAVDADLLNFAMEGDYVRFVNTVAGANMNGTQPASGFKLAGTASATSLTWGVSRGTGAAQVPANIINGIFAVTSTATTNNILIRDSAFSYNYKFFNDGGSVSVSEVMGSIDAGIQISNGAASAEGMDINLVGFYDKLLNTSNALL